MLHSWLGVDPAVPNATGETALEIAKEKKLDGSVKLIEEKLLEQQKKREEAQVKITTVSETMFGSSEIPNQPAIESSEEQLTA